MNERREGKRVDPVDATEEKDEDKKNGEWRCLYGGKKDQDQKDPPLSLDACQQSLIHFSLFNCRVSYPLLLWLGCPLSFLETYPASFLLRRAARHPHSVPSSTFSYIVSDFSVVILPLFLLSFYVFSFTPSFPLSLYPLSFLTSPSSFPFNTTLTQPCKEAARIKTIPLYQSRLLPDPNDSLTI